LNATVYAPEPTNKIDEFDGVFKLEMDNGISHRENLSVKNVIWANSEVTSGTTIGLVIYTGKETKNLLNV
jgi:magnesium-transporting ATPase (P-type)